MDAGSGTTVLPNSYHFSESIAYTPEGPMTRWSMTSWLLWISLEFKEDYLKVFSLIAAPA